jgi:predicted ATPase
VFGRDADVAVVRALIDDGERLVTLVGPAGVGKTRLAHEVAVRCAGRRRGRRVWFVDLSAASDLPQVVRAIEQALDVEERPEGRTGSTGTVRLRALAARLAGAGRALLVLDNCEQATGAVVAACRAVLAEAERLQVVATSRARLRLSFERTHRVEPLAIDGDAALALIEDRLERRGHPPPRGVAERAVLRAIVARLEGIPLAIELAAARLDVVSPAVLLARLEAQLDELADDTVDRPPVQRSLRDAVAASWALLDAPQRDALSRLGVFRGGWTLAGACAVLAPAATGAVEALLHDLVDRSLVRASAAGDGERRFAMYEGLRQFAVEVLTAAGERAATERRLATYVIGETRAVADWSRRLDPDRRRAAEAERENLIAAFEHLIAEPADAAAVDGALVAAGVLASLDLTRGPGDVAADRVGRALAGRRAEAGTPAVVADALGKRAFVLEQLARFAEARAELERGLAVASAAGDTAAELDLLRTLIDLEVREDHAPAAIALARRAVALADRIGDATARAFAGWGLAHALHAGGADDEAFAVIDHALDVEERVVRGPRPAMYVMLRGAILHALGRWDEAAADLDEAVALVRALGAPAYLARYTLARALLAVERGERAAERGLAEAAALAREASDEPTAATAAIAGALTRLARGDVAGATARLAPLRPGRERWSAEPRALFDLVAAAARSAGGKPPRRPRLDAVLVGHDGRTPLLRFARRVIAAAVPDDAGAIAPASGAPALRVSEDCSLVELPGGRRVQLGERAPARRLLRGLVARRLRAPGEALSVSELAVAGWPGERIEARAAKNRVHVALSELRRTGMRDLVRRSARGYFLDPAVHVAVRGGLGSPDA